jgi:hypothetical protein
MKAMTAAQDGAYLTRREALKGLVALMGGSAVAAELLSLAHAAQTDAEVLPRFLSADQFASLGRIVDVMIPETDTPGAYAAGVHRFIDMMLSEYAASESREMLLLGLKDVNEASLASRGSDFVDQPPEVQVDILTSVDAKAFQNPSRSESYRMLKSMILFGYYTSEPGASVELRFNPIPGTTTGCVPVDTFDRAPFKSL